MLSLVVPAYNEEAVIGSTLLEYSSYFSKHKIKAEFIVVIDGNDATEEIVRTLAKKNKNIRLSVSRKRLGKGGAIIRGFKLAKGNLIGFVDADGSTKPEAFHDLLKAFDGVDGVIASRKLAGAKVIRDTPFLQRVGSWGFHLLVNFMFNMPFKDTQCGAKIFKKEAIHSVINNLDITNFAFDIDLLYRLNRNGFKIKEVPTVWKHRQEASKFDFAHNFWKLIPIMLFSICKLRVKHSIFRQYV